MRERQKKGTSVKSLTLLAVSILVIAQVMVALSSSGSLHYALAEEGNAEPQTVEVAHETADLLSNETRKDEVVYARLSNSGAVNNIYVVNTLKPDAPGTVFDYGEYTQVKNLSNLESIEYSKGKVSGHATEEGLSYQGDLVSKNLPWDILISYTLDGKEIDASDLPGKSGALEVSIHTFRNPEVNKTYYENYVLQISVTLSPSQATDISTETGQIALAGSDTQVTFTGMPESDGKFSLKAQATDFEMAGIQIAAVPLSMVIDSLDTGDMMSGFDELTNGVGQLNDGTSELSTGMQEYASGVERMSSGAGSLSANVGALTAGAEGFREGLNSLNANGKKIAAGSTETSAGLQDLSSATGSLEKMLQDPAFQQFLATSPNAQEYMVALGTMTQGLPSAASGYAKFDAGLQEYMAGIEKTAGNYDEYSTGLVEALGGAGKLADGVIATSDGASQLAEGAKELSSGTSELYTEVQKIPDEMQKQIDEMIAGYDKSDYVPLSFTSTKNVNVELVQFVIATDSIEKPEPETTPAEKVEEGFFERLLALFGM